MTDRKTQGTAEGSMPLTGHLRELRNRVLVCVAVWLAAFLVMLSRAAKLVDFFLSIGEETGYRFVYISPQELLLEYFQTAFVFAVLAALPVILFEIWAFAAPGLTKKEKGGFLAVIVFGAVFAALGVFFAYKVMMPFMLQFLSSLDAGTGIEASISVQNYVSFLLSIFIIFAVVFELPVVSCSLTALGVLKAEWMKKGRKVMIVVIFFVAAVITPPDVTSQVMVAVPMIVLFEISIVLCSLIEKTKRKKPVETP